MIIIDFMFYYLSRIDNIIKRKGKSNPKDQAAYIIALSCGFWLFIFDIIIGFLIYHDYSAKVPSIIFVLTILLIYFLIKRVYERNGRYEKLVEMGGPRLRVSDRTGIIISVSIFFLSFFLIICTVLIIHEIK
jgi:hypothetical protein